MVMFVRPAIDNPVDQVTIDDVNGAPGRVSVITSLRQHLLAISPALGPRQAQAPPPQGCPTGLVVSDLLKEPLEIVLVLDEGLQAGATDNSRLSF
jgi:hypothetical protein